MINSPFKKDDRMKKINLIALVLFGTLAVNAQNCPPASEKGIHVVQKGETLYGIARSYGVKMAQIVKLNNLDPNNILQPCTELKMSENASTTTASTPVPESYNAVPVSYNTPLKVTSKSKKSVYVKSNESFHTVQNGETLDEIAEKYGYTTTRLMAMNNMDSEAGFYVGQDLHVSDCPAPSSNTETFNGGNSESSNEFAQAGFAETTQTEVPVAYAQTPTSSPMNGAVGTPNFTYFNTSRYVPFYHIVSNNETVEIIARQYNLSAEDVMMMNNLKTMGALQSGQKLMLEDRTQMTQANYIKSNNPQSAPPQYQPAVQPQYQEPQPASPTTKEANTNEPMSSATAMNSEETDMVNEINLIRSNPVGYIPYIEDYVKDLQKNGDMGNSIQTAYELIAELRKTPRLSTLQPLQCLYIAARKHGNDQRKRGVTDHQGSDGSWPWDRVIRECAQLKDGNENLVGGPANIRRAVILLLVDDGIEGRGHRKTTLNPDWKYVACHKMGTIGDMPNCWVQQYGF